LNWDGILTASIGANEGPDTFQGIGPNGQPAIMRRQLPAANAGETVPLPFFDVEFSLWHKHETVYTQPIQLATVYHRVYVPQVIYVQWLDLYSRVRFTQNVYTNEGVLAIDNMNGSLDEAIDEIIAYMWSKFPPNLNLLIINGETEPDALRSKEHGNIKIVNLEHKPLEGAYKNRRGYAATVGINTDGNATRFGKCYVNLANPHRDLLNKFAATYDENKKANLPLPPPYTHWDVTNGLCLTSLHEPCHLMGLVSQKYLHGDSGKHNIIMYFDKNKNKIFPSVPFVMNGVENYGEDIYYKDAQYDEVFNKVYPVQFLKINGDYLVFILPTPTQGN